jgi:inosose dehydratase
LQENSRALRRMLEQKGMVVSQIDGAFPMMGPLGSSFGVQYVQQTIRFAAELDCPMVDTTDGAFEIAGLNRDEVFRITCDNYRQALPWVEDYNVIINVEPHGPYTKDPEFMLKLFRHFDSRHLGCNFNTGNSFIADHDPVKYLETLRPYVTHLHIKDVSAQLAAAVRGEETGIGSSIVPVGGGVNADSIRKCFQYLHDTAWSRVVSLECHGSDENNQASVAFCRDVLTGL